MSSVPGIKVCWNFDCLIAEDISRDTNNLIEETRSAYRQIADLRNEDVSFESVVKRLADIECHYITYREPLEFPQYIIDDNDLRNSFGEAANRLEEFDNEISLMKDIYEKVVYFRDNCESEMNSISPEFKRYVHKIIQIGTRNGLHLSKEDRGKIQEIKHKISLLSNRFLWNLFEDDSVMKFSEDELAGLSEEFIKRLSQTRSGNRIVTLRYPHFLPIIRRCKDPRTRFLINKAFDSICMRENVPVLEELLFLRQQHAELLGYPNHASFVLEKTMAKTPENVIKFLDELQNKIQPLWEEERNLMLGLKQKECEESGKEFDGKLNYWDVRYYISEINETQFETEREKVREFFPLEAVIGGMFEIYQSLLRLKIEEIANADVWHSDVQLFKVQDAESRDLMGYFFFDLFPRNGKFTNAAVFSLQPGCISPDNMRQVAVSALMINFLPPEEGRPSLLDFEDVEMFFHEFGHIMHQICARTELAHFSGTNIERDFVEAPAQMLEKLVHETDTLQMMSSHFQTRDPIPSTLIQKLIGEQNATNGIYNLRQISLSLIDQNIHLSGTVNTKELCEKIFLDTIGIPIIPGTNMTASFEHIVDEYDSQYYSYLWSEVLAADMFYSRFKTEDLLNDVVGRNFRTLILEPGGTKSALDMLKDFLGREPNHESFLKFLQNIL